MADSKHANCTHLDSALEEIFATHLIFSQSDDEVRVVQQLVHKMVNDIAKEAYSPDSGLTVREVVPAGSMAEGTRIIEPNEFDFMIVLDKFVADDITEIITDTEGTFLNLKAKWRQDNSSFALKEPGPTSNNFTDKSKFAMLDKEMTTRNMLRKATKKIARDGRSYSDKSFPGKLQIKDSSSLSLNGLAITFNLLWEKYGVEEELKTMEISVDLVPVIELQINASFLDQLHIFHQDHYNKLQAIKKFHITNQHPFRNCLFKVSFAFTELQLLQGESETHRKCYKLLKYIYQTNGSCNYASFSSFALKNLVLQHAVSCDGGGLGSCLLKICGDLMKNFGDKRSEIPVIPHIFCTERNLVRSLLKYELLSTYHGLWIYHRNNVSEFIENLQKIRDGMPTPSSFQFRIPNHIPPTTLFNAPGLDLSSIVNI